MAAPGALGSAAHRSSTTGVLVVDDSPVVRRVIRHALAGQPGVRVVGEATDGREGLALARRLRPDAMVLDLNMPVMDGFETLAAIRDHRLAIDVVVFANVDDGEVARVERSVRASGGRLVVKPTGVTDADEAVLTVRRQLLPVLAQSAPAPRSRTSHLRRVVNAVVIASSTGGPNALEAVLGSINELRVPIYVVQHISEGFSGRLADRLDQVCRFPVHEAVDGEHPEPGCAYVSPGGVHLVVEREAGGLAMRLTATPPVNSCRPSADVLFGSSARIYGANQLGVVLTGIGQDGLDGCRELSRLGAPIVVQDRATSVVWGMPGAVAEDGLADEVLPLDAIGSRIERLAALRSVTGDQRS